MIFISSLKYILKKHLTRAIQPKHKYVLANNVQGHKMILKLEDSGENPYPNVLWTDGIYERETTAYIKKNVKDGDVVLDLGSNLGYFTLLLARQVGDCGMVYAFEPHPEMFKILTKNVEMNGYSNIKLYNVAVSDRVGTARFFINSRWAGVSALFGHSLTERAILVDTLDIDSLLLSGVSFVKIDTEGAEPLVLKGMRKTIDRSSDIKIILEFNPHVSGFDANAIFDALYGFKTRNIDGNLVCERV